MITVQNSKVSGSTLPYYGDIEVCGNIEEILDPGEYCPFILEDVFIHDNVNSFRLVGHYFGYYSEDQDIKAYDLSSSVDISENFLKSPSYYYYKKTGVTDKYYRKNISLDTPGSMSETEYSFSDLVPNINGTILYDDDILYNLGTGSSSSYWALYERVLSTDTLTKKLEFAVTSSGYQHGKAKGLCVCYDLETKVILFTGIAKRTSDDELFIYTVIYDPETDSSNTVYTDTGITGTILLDATAVYGTYTDRHYYYSLGRPLSYAAFIGDINLETLSSTVKVVTGTHYAYPAYIGYKNGFIYWIQTAYTNTTSRDVMKLELSSQTVSVVHSGDSSTYYPHIITNEDNVLIAVSESYGYSIYDLSYSKIADVLGETLPVYDDVENRLWFVRRSGADYYLVGLRITDDDEKIISITSVVIETSSPYLINYGDHFRYETRNILLKDV